jgi:hypothetical protein
VRAGVECGYSGPKRIKGLGDSSAHWFIAALAVETGIAPSALLAEEPRMLWTMQRYLVARSQKQSGKR